MFDFRFAPSSALDGAFYFLIQRFKRLEGFKNEFGPAQVSRNR